MRPCSTLLDMIVASFPVFTPQLSPQKGWEVETVGMRLMLTWMMLLALSRSTDYGKTFVNETDKFDNDTVIEWYYISPDQANVSRGQLCVV